MLMVALLRAPPPELQAKLQKGGSAGAQCRTLVNGLALVRHGATVAESASSDEPHMCPDHPEIHVCSFLMNYFQG